MQEGWPTLMYRMGHLWYVLYALDKAIRPLLESRAAKAKRHCTDFFAEIQQPVWHATRSPLPV
jgi:hypothetical protein